MDTLFQELDQIIPNNFMSQTFEDSSASLASATPPRTHLTSAQQEVSSYFYAVCEMCPVGHVWLHTAQHLHDPQKTQVLHQSNHQGALHMHSRM